MTISQKIQISLFYVSAALILVPGAFLALQNILILAALSVVAMVIVAAAISHFWEPIQAAKMILIACLLGSLFYIFLFYRLVLIFWGITPLLKYPWFLLVLCFLGMTFPFAYAWQAQAAVTPVRVWIKTPPAKRLLLLTLLLTVLSLLANLLFLNQTRLITHELVIVSISPTKHCQDQGFQGLLHLKTIETPTLSLSSCITGEAITYLEMVESNILPITFQVSYDIFVVRTVHGLEIVAIGEWNSSGRQAIATIGCLSEPKHTVCGGQQVRREIVALFGYFR